MLKDTCTCQHMAGFSHCIQSQCHDDLLSLQQYSSSCERDDKQLDGSQWSAARKQYSRIAILSGWSATRSDCRQ